MDKSMMGSHYSKSGAQLARALMGEYVDKATQLLQSSYMKGKLDSKRGSMVNIGTPDNEMRNQD